jgi:hypothetical protein
MRPPVTVATNSGVSSSITVFALGFGGYVTQF